MFSTLNSLTTKGYDSYVFVSQTVNSPADYRKAVKLGGSVAGILRNPLPWNKKVEFLTRLYTERYPEVTVSSNENIKTIAEAIKYLYTEGEYDHLSLVCGEDRATEYKDLLKRFSDAEPDFPISFSIIIAGDRDPDAEDVTGISATKLRQFAEKDQLEYFSEGIDSDDSQLIKDIYEAVKKGLTIPKEYYTKKGK